MVFVDTTVRQDQNVCALPVCPVCFHEQTLNGFFETCALIIGSRDYFHLKSVHFHIFNFHQIGIRKDRIIDL